MGRCTRRRTGRIGFVSADGRHRFYSERNPLRANPTDFVKVAMYPLLDRDDTAVLLTPAVYAAARNAGAKPLPVSVRVCVHGQREEFCTADFRSREPDDV